VIKVPIKNKELFSIAGQVPVFTKCPDTRADNLRQLLLPWTFKLLSLQSPFIDLSPFQLANHVDCAHESCPIQLRDSIVLEIKLKWTSSPVFLFPRLFVRCTPFCRCKFCLAYWLLSCVISLITPQYLKDISNNVGCGYPLLMGDASRCLLVVALGPGESSISVTNSEHEIESQLAAQGKGASPSQNHSGPG
jgi:hypothetical protein